MIIRSRRFRKKTRRLCKSITYNDEFFALHFPEIAVLFHSICVLVSILCTFAVSKRVVMIIKEELSREETALSVAKQMITAARTAPKACGIDNLMLAIADGDDIIRLSDCLKAIYEEKKMEFLLRDSLNILSAQCIVLAGCRNVPTGLDCAYCGFATCAEKPRSVPCFFASHDLGLAIGSAVSVAADNRVDTRIMFSAGLAAKRLNLLADCDFCFAIPVSISGKNPFFDRKFPPIEK